MGDFRPHRLNIQVVRTVILRLMPVCAIVGIALPLMLGHSHLTILGLYLGIPMIIAPIIYARYQNSSFRFVQFENRKFCVLATIYFLSFAVSLILLYIYDIRIYFYYVVVVILITAILLEILYFNLSSKKSALIILQIVAVVLNLLWGVTLNVHYFIGNTDVICHVWWINNLLNSGYVTDIFDLYKAFPLWHILISSLYQILDPSVQVHKLMFFTNGIIYCITILVIYRISSKLFNNEKIALLSALFLCIYPDFLFYGMYSISRSVVNILVFLLIFILLERENTSKRFLILILVFTIIAYHTASMPFILMIILLIYILQYFITVKSEDQLVTPYIMIFIAVMTLGYWIYVSVDIFQTFIENMIIKAPEGTLTQSAVDLPFNEVFNYLQFSPLLLFVILGCIWALEYRKTATIGKTFCLNGLLLTAVAFPGPVLLVNKFARNLNIGRFGEYAMIFIVITGALGFYLLHARATKFQKYLVITLFVVMCFLSVSNDFIASDNPLVKRPYYTNYLTEEDTVAFDRVVNSTMGYVMADYVVDRYIYRSEYGAKSHILEVDAKNYRLLRSKPDDVIIVREGELIKRPVKLYSSPTDEFMLKPSWDTLEYYYADSRIWSTINQYNKIYHSGKNLAIM